MSRLLIAGLVMLLVGTAYGGGNPNIRAYIDFDPPDYAHEITPLQYTTVTAYLCVDRIDTGVCVISFRLTDLTVEYPQSFAAASWTTIWPGCLPIWCDPWEEPGVTIASTECQLPEFEPSVVGMVQFFYLGGTGCLEILDHTEYPRWTVDCTLPAGEVDLYCVLANGSISGAACADGDCSEVPIGTSSWGTVKSLYR